MLFRQALERDLQQTQQVCIKLQQQAMYTEALKYMERCLTLTSASYSEIRIQSHLFLLRRASRTRKHKCVGGTQERDRSVQHVSYEFSQHRYLSHVFLRPLNALVLRGARNLLHPSNARRAAHGKQGWGPHHRALASPCRNPGQPGLLLQEEGQTTQRSEVPRKGLRTYYCQPCCSSLAFDRP